MLFALTRLSLIAAVFLVAQLQASAQIPPRALSEAMRNIFLLPKPRCGRLVAS